MYSYFAGNNQQSQRKNVPNVISTGINDKNGNPLIVIEPSLDQSIVEQRRTAKGKVVPKL